MKREEIEKVIQESICEVTDRWIDDLDDNLLSDRCRIVFADCLYIMDRIEKKLGFPVVQILGEKDYRVFTIRNLADEISRLTA